MGSGWEAFTNPESPVVIHVPHSGLHWPDGFRQPDAIDLEPEIRLMADLHTDQLAHLVAAACIDNNGVAPNLFINWFSRVFVDPERFDDESEEMNRVGMGVVYERTHDGEALYQNLLTEAEIEQRKEYQYRPYAKAISDLVAEVLNLHGCCLIIDLHSYAVKPLPSELHKEDDRPQICLGFDQFHAPDVAIAEMVFHDAGYVTARNQPYRGSYVPLKYWDTDSRVKSIMLEIRKDQYLTDGHLDGDKTARIAQAIFKCIQLSTSLSESGC